MSKDIDADLVRKLAGLLDETGLGELEYATDDWRIRVARPAAPALVNTHVETAPAAPATVAAIPVPAPVAETGPAAADHPGAVKSPMVGTAYLGPDPDSTPFVQVGATVTKGQTLLIIEAMKVMNPISAPRAGRIAEVLVENGHPVEFGQVLVVIE